MTCPRRILTMLQVRQVRETRFDGVQSHSLLKEWPRDYLPFQLKATVGASTLSWCSATTDLSKSKCSEVRCLVSDIAVLGGTDWGLRHPTRYDVDLWNGSCLKDKDNIDVRFKKISLTSIKSTVVFYSKWRAVTIISNLSIAATGFEANQERLTD